MNKSVLIIVACFAFLSACVKKTDLIINNNTRHNVYYTLNHSEEYILPGGKTHNHNFNLGKKYLLDEPQKKVNIRIEGETYQLPYGYDENQITLKHDSDYRIFLWPTNAGLKVENNSDKVISSVKYVKNFINRIERSENLLNSNTFLRLGDEFWCRITHNENFTDQNKNFHYTFEVSTLDDSLFVFGDSELFLEKDDQFLILFE